jgi:hypothetical protein
MERIIGIGLAVVMVLAVPLAGLAQQNVKELFWLNPEQTPPMSGEEIKAKYYSGLPFQLNVVYKTDTDKWASPFLIIVNGDLYPEIEDKLVLEYIPLLEGEGITVEVWTALYGTPEDLRNAMADYYAEHGYYYCMQVGEFPPPLSEIGFFEGESTPYPIDLFFMDLDGTWEDTDSNGYYDTHTGNVEPDIAFGRLAAYTLNYQGNNEAALINHYLDKDMAYRRGEVTDIQQRALAFIDDDWFPNAQNWADCLSWVYSDTTLIADNTTIASVYRDVLDDNYEYIFLAAHSNPNLHQFKVGGDWESDYVTYNNIYDIQPVAEHYNFFCCSAAQYTYNNYIVGWYIFNNGNYGLTGTGSAKTGSMLNYEDFYPVLAFGEPFGEAFRWWFSVWGESDRQWFYGMTLIGDPLLKPLSHMVDVNLLYFRARAKTEGLELSWEIGNGASPQGFNLYRRQLLTGENCHSLSPADSSALPGTPEVKLNLHLITGSGVYQYLDNTAEPGITYVYRLEAVEDQKTTTVGNCQGSMPKGTSFYLSQNYPNPWSGETKVTFSVAQDGPVTISLYDISGRLVKELVNDNLRVGEHQLTVDDSGLESGLYILRLVSGEQSAVRTTVLIK